MVHTDDQPITHREFRSELLEFRTGLQAELREFGRQLTTSLVTQFRMELDSKLAVQATRLSAELKAHTEETVATHTSEIMQVIANVVEPMQDQLTSHEHRLTTLEARPV